MTARPFTGRHMTMILVGFFGVVIAVNFIMARYAIHSFGGTVVENSYVASQKYNDWLKQARAQKALGWDIKIGMDGSRHAMLSLAKSGTPIIDAKVTATITHPLGRLPQQQFTFAHVGGGNWRSDTALPPGRWLIRLVIDEGGHRAILMTRLRGECPRRP